MSFFSRQFDVAAALASWPPAPAPDAIPIFKGKAKKKTDPSVETWLSLVESGCTARSVPKSFWPAIAKHFVAGKAKDRLEEVERVMRGLNGDKWSWDWKRFKAAINNMGWDVDTQKTKEVKVKVEKKSTGWWVVGKGGEQSVIPVVKDKDKGKEAKRTAAAPAPKATASPIVTKAVPEAKPKPRREGSTSSIMSTISLPFSRPAPPPPPPPPSSALTTLTAQIPLWLLAATEAIAAVGNEHSDALTTIAAILISLGGLHAGGSPALCMATEVAGAIGRTLKAASNGEGHRH